MKKLGILISSPKPKKIRKSVSEWAEEIRKSGPHKYVKREGSPGNYKYYYRLPNGGIGTREDLEAATRGKKPEDQKGKRPLNFYEPGKPKRDQAAAARRKIPANAPKLGIRISGIDVKGNKVSGEVTNQGADGVTIDHKNHIAYGNVTSTEGGGQDTTKTATKKEWVDPENFNAAEWKKQWDNPKANKDNAGVESIMNSFEMLKDEIERHVKETDAKNYELIYTKQLTYQLYRKIGEGPSSIYSKERVELHDEIEREIMAPDKIHSANPAVGEKPTFIMLGGRGGSGKSWFQNNIYDPGKFVILDADVIKERISEYDGWNANQVHEESSDILEKILQKCLEQGLNVVLDATMKSPEKAVEKLAKFIAGGYKTEVHYMHLPRQEAAKRAVMRYRNGKKEGDYKGRYVPVKVVLGMTTNEETFDLVKNMVDSWSFRDNNVRRGEQPILISESRKPIKKSLLDLDFYLKKADDRGGGQVMKESMESKEMTREEAEKYYNDPDNWEYDCHNYEGEAAKLDPHTDEFLNGLFKEAGVELQ